MLPTRIHTPKQDLNSNQDPNGKQDPKSTQDPNSNQVPNYNQVPISNRIQSPTRIQTPTSYFKKSNIYFSVHDAILNATGISSIRNLHWAHLKLI